MPVAKRNNRTAPTITRPISATRLVLASIGTRRRRLSLTLGTPPVLLARRSPRERHTHPSVHKPLLRHRSAAQRLTYSDSSFMASTSNRKLVPSAATSVNTCPSAAVIVTADRVGS